MKKNEVNEEEETKQSKLSLIFTNYKENPAFKALIKLSLYFLLFLIIIVVVSFGNTNISEENTPVEEEPTEQIVEPKSYKEMLNDVLIDNNSLKYEIKLNEEIYMLDYTIGNNILNGIIENNKGITKFTYKDNIVYEIKLNEEKENNELFNNMNLDFINIYSLINILSNSKAMKLLNDDTTIYNYTIEESQVTVTVSNEKINTIDITEGLNSYKVEIVQKGE